MNKVNRKNPNSIQFHQDSVDILTMALKDQDPSLLLTMREMVSESVTFAQKAILAGEYDQAAEILDITSEALKNAVRTYFEKGGGGDGL